MPAVPDFRTGMPRGFYPTPPDVPSGERSAEGRWIKDIHADGTVPMHHFVPVYDGDGGQPWSLFEMSVVRDLLLFEVRQATGECAQLVFPMCAQVDSLFTLNALASPLVSRAAGLDELSSAKFIRLPFHDCLHYEGEASGRCDGSINFENVGFRHEGLVEERNYKNYKCLDPSLSNNGFGDAVEFLEYLSTLDLGMAWVSGCYLKQGVVSGNGVHLAGTRTYPIWVSSIKECKGHCLNTDDCKYFTVWHMRTINGRGACRLFNSAGTQRETSGSSRLIAGDAYCEADSWSLKSRGKSRADLWAFASLVAVEEAIQRHNWACNGDRRSPHNGPIMCTQVRIDFQSNDIVFVHYHGTILHSTLFLATTMHCSSRVRTNAASRSPGHLSSRLAGRI